jgi:hypothetical protein
VKRKNLQLKKKVISSGFVKMVWLQIFNLLRKNFAKKETSNHSKFASLESLSLENHSMPNSSLSITMFLIFTLVKFSKMLKTLTKLREKNMSTRSLKKRDSLLLAFKENKNEKLMKKNRSKLKNKETNVDEENYAERRIKLTMQIVTRKEKQRKLRK